MAQAMQGSVQSAQHLELQPGRASMPGSQGLGMGAFSVAQQFEGAPSTARDLPTLGEGFPVRVMPRLASVVAWLAGIFTHAGLPQFSTVWVFAMSRLQSIRHSH